MNIEDLLRSQSHFCQDPDGTLRATGSGPSAILSGSFNPLHPGHVGLAQVASNKLGREVAFELSIRNVDKPELDAEEVSRRLVQFHRLFSVWITRAPTFAEKAKLFPGVTMIVGFDTAKRIIDPKYYGHEPHQRDAALELLRSLDCRFLVAGRVDGEGAFWGLDQLELPPSGEMLFMGLSESEFRLDISSTEMRRRMAEQPA